MVDDLQIIDKLGSCLAIAPYPSFVRQSRYLGKHFHDERVCFPDPELFANKGTMMQSAEN